MAPPCTVGAVFSIYGRCRRPRPPIRFAPLSSFDQATGIGRIAVAIGPRRRKRNDRQRQRLRGDSTRLDLYLDDDVVTVQGDEDHGPDGGVAEQRTGHRVQSASGRTCDERTVKGRR